jgi:hypothetical protein
MTDALALSSVSRHTTRLALRSQPESLAALPSLRRRATRRRYRRHHRSGANTSAECSGALEGLQASSWVVIELKSC